MRLGFSWARRHQSAYLRPSGRARSSAQCQTRQGPGRRGASPVGKPRRRGLPHTGVVTTFTVVRIPFEGQKLTPPYSFGAIVLDGADLPIYHLISGVL
ncbi:MAG: OB-fold domain-containing protein [Sandaracinaceae bacterium]|nr:OB-fold domain-containing protein [Sandaracinaceae bacterium]